MQGQLPLNALRAFEVAARHMSFTKAAEELHVTPAAISQQIKTLEAYIGMPLFHRYSNGLSLTKAAEAALPALQEGFSGVAQGMQHLRKVSSPNRLDVWVAPSFAIKWLMPRLNRFTDAHPEIDLRLNASDELMDTDSTTISDFSKHFRQQGIDVAVRFGDGHYPGCQVEMLMSATVAPMCSPSLLKDRFRPLRNPDDLLSHSLLYDETPYEGRPDWKDWLELAGVKDANRASGLHFNHVSLALQAACDGQGVVLSIEQLAQIDIDQGRLVVPFDLRIELEPAYHIVSLTGTEEESAATQFWQWLLKEAGEFTKSGLSPTDQGRRHA
ncbi:MAG: transcriptional regulator GcvA [Granulosicoccus sp.]